MKRTVPQRTSAEHSTPEGLYRAQCPRRAGQNTVPNKCSAVFSAQEGQCKAHPKNKGSADHSAQRGSAEHNPRGAVESTGPRKGSAEAKFP